LRVTAIVDVHVRAQVSVEDGDGGVDTGPGMFETFLTLRTGNARVHVWAYHAIAPHTLVDGRGVRHPMSPAVGAPAGLRRSS
jgi:hypothetical protein